MSIQKNNFSWFRFLRPTLRQLTGGLREGSIRSTDFVLYLLLRSETALSSTGFTRGQIEMSVGEIVELTGFSRSTVKRSLSNLIQGGFLSRVSQQGQSGIYLAHDIAVLETDGKKTARWDYIPRDETQLLQDLTAFERGDRGELPEAVQINIQINNYYGTSGADRQSDSQDLGDMIAMINDPRTPPTLREKLRQSYARLNGDPGHL